MILITSKSYPQVIHKSKILSTGYPQLLRSCASANPCQVEILEVTGAPIIQWPSYSCQVKIWLSLIENKNYSLEKLSWFLYNLFID